MYTVGGQVCPKSSRLKNNDVVYISVNQGCDFLLRSGNIISFSGIRQNPLMYPSLPSLGGRGGHGQILGVVLSGFDPATKKLRFYRLLSGLMRNSSVKSARALSKSPVS